MFLIPPSLPTWLNFLKYLCSIVIAPYFINLLSTCPLILIVIQQSH